MSKGQLTKGGKGEPGGTSKVVSAQAPLGVRATLKSARLAIAEGEEAAIRQFLPDLQEIMQGEDIKEGIRSFIERRQAHFKGR